MMFILCNIYNIKIVGFYVPIILYSKFRYKNTIFLKIRIYIKRYYICYIVGVIEKNMFSAFE